MDARFYNSDEIDIERLGQDLVNIYLAQHYQAQNVGGKDQVLVQLKKGGDFEAILGMQAALTVTIQKTANGVLAMIGQQKWIDKAAVGAVGIAVLPLLWPLAITAGVGALRQASLGNQVLNMVDSLVRQQRPNIVAGPVPAQLLPQMQQQWAPPTAPPPYYTPPPSYAQPQPQPEIPVAPPPRAASVPAPAPAPVGRSKLRCQYCNTPYEAGDTFCTGCGRSLTPPKVYCPNCHAELKPNTSFCANCGSSTFQAVTTANQPASPKAAPVTPVPTVTYTTPAPVQAAQPAPATPAAPYYTPPAQPAAQAPIYTPPPPPPPPAPKAPVYTPPAPPARPPVPEYIPPPQMQEPPVKPQPKVTIVPGASKPDAPGLTPPPPTPQQTYYVPSAPVSSVAPTVAAQPLAQQAAADQPTVADVKPAAPDIVYYTPPASSPAAADQPTIAGTGPKPLAPQPSSQPAFDPGTPWGMLNFSDGREVPLSGERALVGRYDHDLGGITPEVDLNGVQGVDTVSRVHASLEHIGSTYVLTDLNSTNATRLNGKRLEPDKATPINDGDTLQFGKVTCTFQKL